MYKNQKKRAIRILRSRYGNFCFYCRCPLKETTLDHFIPKALGGGSTIDNLVLACRGCNRRKGDKIPILVDIVRLQLRRNPLDVTEQSNEVSQHVQVRARGLAKDPKDVQKPKNMGQRILDALKYALRFPR